MLSGGETVTCTFHNAREKGAILITKTRKHAADGPGDHPHAGVTFKVTGGELPAAGVTAVTNADGEACVDGLLLSSLTGVGDYTVTETVPAGYVADGATAKTVTVSNEATCAAGTEGDRVVLQHAADGPDGVGELAGRRRDRVDDHLRQRRPQRGHRCERRRLGTRRPTSRRARSRARS